MSEVPEIPEEIRPMIEESFNDSYYKEIGIPYELYIYSAQYGLKIIKEMINDIVLTNKDSSLGEVSQIIFNLQSELLSVFPNVDPFLIGIITEKATRKIISYVKSPIFELNVIQKLLNKNKPDII